MPSRPFALIGASSLSAVCARFEAQVEAWSRGWGIAEAGIKVSCARAWETPKPTGRTSAIHGGTAPFQRWFEGDAGCGRVAWQRSVEKSLQHAMFPGSQHAFSDGGEAVIATEAGEAALGSLIEFIAGLLTGTTEVAVGGEWVDACRRPGSGAILVTVSVHTGSDPLTVLCLLDHAAVRTVEAPVPKAVAARGKPSLARALRDVAVALPVTVGEAEVDLASLSALSVGDVIRLEAPVDAPSKLRATDGAPLLDVFLGRIGPDVAVEVVARRKSSE
jgi:hypothetical protein